MSKDTLGPSVLAQIEINKLRERVVLLEAGTKSLIKECVESRERVAELEEQLDLQLCLPELNECINRLRAVVRAADSLTKSFNDSGLFQPVFWDQMEAAFANLEPGDI